MIAAAVAPWRATWWRFDRFARHFARKVAAIQCTWPYRSTAPRVASLESCSSTSRASVVEWWPFARRLVVRERRFQAARRRSGFAICAGRQGVRQPWIPTWEEGKRRGIDEVHFEGGEESKHTTRMRVCASSELCCNNAMRCLCSSSVVIAAKGMSNHQEN